MYVVTLSVATSNLKYLLTYCYVIDFQFNKLLEFNGFIDQYGMDIECVVTFSPFEI